MRQLYTRDQMTQKLTTIGHRTALNNEQSPHHIVSYNSMNNTHSQIYLIYLFSLK